jgi:polysaccharide deacetylase family protein (PEP-CTERM system associated)
MINALSIDVEDYWSIFSRDWLHKDMEPTESVVKNTEWFLQELSNSNVQATFFVLGEVAKTFPDLVKRITEQGHEIGVHGYYHKQIFKLTREEFFDEISRCKVLLEDLTGKSVVGHRAPAFSLNAETDWAFEVLAEVGFKYDSSVSPLITKRYGWPGFGKDICTINLPSKTRIIEVPISTVSFLGREFNIGGGFLRCFPYTFTKRAFSLIQKKRPGIIYIHPYEIDTWQIQFETTHLLGKQRRNALRFHRLQLLNRGTMKKKVTKILRDFEFATIRDVVEQSLS